MALGLVALGSGWVGGDHFRSFYSCACPGMQPCGFALEMAIGCNLSFLSISREILKNHSFNQTKTRRLATAGPHRYKKQSLSVWARPDHHAGRK